MSWKSGLAFIIFILAAVSLTLYWVLPLGQIKEFGVSGPVNSNFTINASFEEEMQFYENLRYKKSDISYSVSDDCSLPKLDEIQRATEILENSTILNFYEVEDDAEIEVTCEDSVSRGERGAFIAGEGGVTRVVSSGDFSVILNGKVLLLRDTQCADPIVGIHEFLHALGFDHSDNPNNIMYPTVRCQQTIGEDIPAYIEWIYSFQTLPDLTIENASASIQGRYIDLALTVRNEGLEDAGNSKIVIYADGKEIKEFDVDSLEIGSGRKITLTNVPLSFTQRTVHNEIEFLVEYDSEELDKNNNVVTLEIKNSE